YKRHIIFTSLSVPPFTTLCGLETCPDCNNNSYAICQLCIKCFKARGYSEQQLVNFMLVNL
ncbi:MAG: hypothetical protein AABY22_15715, partial [Nanoarchaeota archaeon]